MIDVDRRSEISDAGSEFGGHFVRVDEFFVLFGVKKAETGVAGCAKHAAAASGSGDMLAAVARTRWPGGMFGRVARHFSRDLRGEMKSRQLTVEGRKLRNFGWNPPVPTPMFGQQCDSVEVTGEAAVSAASKGLRGAMETRFWTARHVKPFLFSVIPIYILQRGPDSVQWNEVDGAY